MAERFINAAKDGFVDPLREATRKDLNTPDEDGMTATMWAAHNGNLEALRLIVGREGDVNKSDHHGMTCLHHAALGGHMDVVSYLVNWGCNIYSLDNDQHSALDIALLNERTGIVKYLDGELAQNERKNPRQASKLKEEAIRLSESNRKKFDKMVEAASKKAEKEQRKFNQSNGVENGDKSSKKSFLKTLTLRRKGNNNHHNRNSAEIIKNGQASSKYSDMVGMTYTRNQKGIAKKIQMKKFDTSNHIQKSEFKVSEMDGSGQRTVRSLGASQGYFGSMSEVMYLNNQKDARRGSEPVPAEDIGITRRPAYDIFHKKSKSKSESDLLDSSLYENDDEEDDDNQAGIFNRPQFGQLAFFSKRPFVNTLQSFDDTKTPSEVDPKEYADSGVSHGSLPNGNDVNNSPFPWDEDDLDALDDDEGTGSQKEFSAVETFLSASGLASYLHIFSQEDIDFELLVNMSDADLKELGLPFGPRKKLEEAIKRRKNILSTPSIMSDSFL